jgi:hypothetical protein
VGFHKTLSFDLIDTESSSCTKIGVPIIHVSHIQFDRPSPMPLMNTSSSTRSAFSYATIPPTPSLVRTRTPTSGVTADPPSSQPPPIPVISPAQRRARTPPANGLPVRQVTGPTSRERPSRALNTSPAPPPRSMNRPGSGMSHRLPPVAVPQREPRNDLRHVPRTLASIQQLGFPISVVIFVIAT